MYSYYELISLVSLLVVWTIATVVLVALGLTLALTGHPISHVDMLLGMGLGMSTGPIMMVAIKRWRIKRKINKMLNDIIQMRKEQTNIEEKAEEQKEAMPL